MRRRYDSSTQRKPKELLAANAMVDKLLRKLGYSPENYVVFDLWDRLLGPDAGKARAVGRQGDRLVVEVDSHARLHDLLLRKRTILKKLNALMGTQRPISDIIVKMGAARRRPPAA